MITHRFYGVVDVVVVAALALVEEVRHDAVLEMKPFDVALRLEHLQHKDKRLLSLWTNHQIKTCG